MDIYDVALYIFQDFYILHPEPFFKNILGASGPGNHIKQSKISFAT